MYSNLRRAVTSLLSLRSFGQPAAQGLADLPASWTALTAYNCLQQTRCVKKQASEVRHECSRADGHRGRAAAPLHPPTHPSHAQLRSGNVIELNGRLLQVMAFDKKAMGRQLGNVQLELRDVVTKVCTCALLSGEEKGGECAGTNCRTGEPDEKRRRAAAGHQTRNQRPDHA